MELTARKKQILKVVTERYIDSAEPVGSKYIAEAMGGSVSSATIRNELADLVELGYLEQPHTSAGRIPSAKGYREYVDRLSKTAGETHQDIAGGKEQLLIDYRPSVDGETAEACMEAITIRAVTDPIVQRAHCIQGRDHAVGMDLLCGIRVIHALCSNHFRARGVRRFCKARTTLRICPRYVHILLCGGRKASRVFGQRFDKG